MRVGLDCQLRRRAFARPSERIVSIVRPHRWLTVRPTRKPILVALRGQRLATDFVVAFAAVVTVFSRTYWRPSTPCSRLSSMASTARRSRMSFAIRSVRLQAPSGGPGDRIAPPTFYAGIRSRSVASAMRKDAVSQPLIPAVAEGSAC